MTNILAIETSCEQGSLALLCGDSILTRKLPDGGSKHSASVLPESKALLAESGIALSALDTLAFGCGPGAFTGVRLACGVAQGLALGADLPVAAISSLEALALPWRSQAPRIYCAMDARMSEVYVAMFEVEKSGLVQQSEAICCPPDAMPLPEGEYLGLGNALAAYGVVIKARLGAAVRWASEPSVPSAESVARLAAAKPESWLDAALAAPDYVRNRVAFTTAERLAQGGRA